MSRLILLLSILSGFSLPLIAQIEDPVDWVFEKKQIDGDAWELIFTAHIEDGWDVYSQFLDEGGPVPTSLNFESTEGFELIGEAVESGSKKEGYDNIFDMDVVKFYDRLTIIQKIKIDPATLRISGYVEYMTCDATRCLPPTPVDFEFQFEAPANLETSDDIVPSSTDQGSLKMGPLPGMESDESMKDPVKWSGKTIFFDRDQGRATLRFEGTIDDGWHVYSSQMEEDSGPIPLNLVLEDPTTDGYTITEATEESEDVIEAFDDIFEVEVIKLKHSVALEQELIFTSGSPILEGYIEYMACTDVECVFPQPVSFHFNPESGVLTMGDPNEGGTGNIATTDEMMKGLYTYYNLDPEALDKQDAVNCVAAEDNHTLIEGSGNRRIFILGFLGGLLALLTPCVFPMIPLTVSFFTKSDDKKKSNGIGKATLYGASILAIYVIFSIPFHFLDTINPDILNNISTNVGLNVFFFIVFLFFAFSFFGYYELTLPSSWTNKVSKAEGIGGFVGVFFMAMTLALVSFSCTGPILGSLLAGSLSSDGGAIQLTMGMSGFGLALALPFTFFAAFPSFMNKMPKSGSWLNTVKVVMGFLELGLAFKFLSNADMVEHWGLLKIEPFLIIWTLVAVGLGLYLFGLIRFPHDSRGVKISLPRKALGVLSFVFAVYLLSGFRYNEDAQTFTSLKLLSGLAPPVGYSWIHPNDCPNNIDCFKDLSAGLEYARKVNLPVLIDFSGYACVNCRKMEEHVWPNPGIKKLMDEEFVLISLYVDDRTKLPEAEQISLPKHTGGERTLRTIGDKWHFFQTEYFHNNSQPLYALMGPDGKLLNKPVGYTPSVEDFRDFLQCGLDAYEEQKEYLGAIE